MLRYMVTTGYQAGLQADWYPSIRGTTACCQFRFSLYSGAVITKVLAVVVFLYYPLVSSSVEYPMPYASCLVSYVVVVVSLPFKLPGHSSALLQLCLSSCVLPKGALLV